MILNQKSQNKNLKFDTNNYKHILQKENTFIKNLLSSLPIPTSALPEQEEQTIKQVRKLNGVKNEKSRAQSLTELQERLQIIQSKKKLNYKDKLMKKGLKNRLKKKSKLEERNLNKKLVKIQKMNEKGFKEENGTEEKNTVKVKKPVFNKEGKMVFSKFDFTGLGQPRQEKKETDPKKILKNLEVQKAKLKELEEKGEKEKVIELKEKQAWKSALAKTEGQKVRDDPILLKKTIKKREQKRKGSQKKWEARQELVKKTQEARQQKRTENLDKRKKDKKLNKMRKAVKRGKIIPGF